MQKIQLDTRNLLGFRLVASGRNDELKSASYYAAKISVKPGGKPDTIKTAVSGSHSSHLAAKVGGKPE